MKINDGPLYKLQILYQFSEDMTCYVGIIIIFGFIGTYSEPIA